MSNFIFAKPPKKECQYVFSSELKKQKDSGAWWNKPVIKDYLRISIGTGRNGTDSLPHSRRDT